VSLRRGCCAEIRYRVEDRRARVPRGEQTGPASYSPGRAATGQRAKGSHHQLGRRGRTTPASSTAVSILPSAPSLRTIVHDAETGDRPHEPCFLAEHTEEVLGRWADRAQRLHVWRSDRSARRALGRYLVDRRASGHSAFGRRRPRVRNGPAEQIEAQPGRALAGETNLTERRDLLAGSPSK
jgi:hypothetical protein